jgi:hypothetical protein
MELVVIAFPQQGWFRERASTLRCTYIACLVENLRMPQSRDYRILCSRWFVAAFIRVHQASLS